MYMSKLLIIPNLIVHNNCYEHLSDGLRTFSKDMGLPKQIKPYLSQALKINESSFISPSEMILLFTLILTAVPDKSLVYREMCGHSQLPREGAYLVSH